MHASRVTGWPSVPLVSGLGHVPDPGRIVAWDGSLAVKHLGIMSYLPLHVLAMQKVCRVAVGALLVSG
jgi:hypothetical protein